jgi:hypothetical protein
MDLFFLWSAVIPVHRFCFSSVSLLCCFGQTNSACDRRFGQKRGGTSHTVFPFGVLAIPSPVFFAFVLSVAWGRKGKRKKTAKESHALRKEKQSDSLHDTLSNSAITATK